MPAVRQKTQKKPVKKPLKKPRAEPIATARRRASMLDLAAFGRSVSSIADELGLARNTVMHFLSEPGTEQKLRAIRDQLRDQHQRMLQAKVEAAIGTLVAGMAGKLGNDRQLRAAVEVLDRTGIVKQGAVPLVTVEAPEVSGSAGSGLPGAGYFADRSETEIAHYAEHGTFPSTK